MFQEGWQALLDFLFPPHCPVCHAYVPRSGDWCPSCLQDAQKPHQIVLPTPMRSLIGTAWALGVYRGGLRGLIHALKYKKQRSTLPYIETFLQQTGLVLADDYDFAVPVPLHRQREKWRGFNQVEVIFRGWLAAKGIPLRRALVRTKKTVPLYDHTPQERREILSQAFELSDDAAVAGRNILLLDDILTTGATLFACAAVLKRAGAARVDVLVFASDHR